LRTLAQLILSNPRKIAAAWLVLAVAGAALGLGLAHRVTNGGYEVAGSESAKANDVAGQVFGERSEARAYVVLTGASPEALQRDAARVRSEIAGSAGVAGVGQTIPAPDGSVTLVPVTLEGDLGKSQNYASTLQAELHSLDLGPTRADLIGQAAVYDRYRVHSKEDLTKAALISFPVTLAILLAAFLSITAALIPLALAGACLAVAFGGLYILTFVIELNVFAEDIVLVLCLGLSIDFSLFLVTRVRECLARQPGDLEAAVVEAMCTAGKAIAMSGVTVAAALAGLLLIGVSFFSSMAIGAMGAVLVAVVAALSLAPAAIVLLAGHLDRFQVRPASSAAANGAFWRRLAGFVVRHRIGVATVITLGLLVASVPAPSVAIGFRTFSALPPGDPVRQASEAAGQAFGPGAATPAFVVSKADGAQLHSLVAKQPGVREARPPQQGRGGWVRVDAVLSAPPDQNAAEDVVERMRSSLATNFNIPALVGGPTAEAVDFSTRLDSRTPLVVLVTLLVEMLILTALLRAPVIALKAALTTLLSVTATIGIVTVVFGTSGEIGFFVPVMLFTIVFGLSTDYEVFLLSRVRENYLRGQSNVESLKVALVRSSRAITLAGMTMAVVFFAFATSSLPSFTQIGFGVGTAILIDVTLVRGLLVPATVALLGDANWWWPGRSTRVEALSESSSASVSD
jgi:RND superfamily putative drug exporter